MIRIVKLYIKKEYCEDFKNFFENNKHKILSQEGCQHVELLNSIDNSQIFFTYSHWEHPHCLEKYRQCDFFNNVWSQVKPWFEQKAEAWSVEKL